MSSKFRNVPTVIDGIRFDSQAEARRYGELVLLWKACAISSLVVHPMYKLADKARDPRTGKALRAIWYKGDFEYVEQGRRVVEDVKGVETPVFKIKRHLFVEKYPDIELRVLSV